MTALVVLRQFGSGGELIFFRASNVKNRVLDNIGYI
jgi:hypothetical protein